MVLSGDDGVEMQNHPAMSEEEEPDEELLGPPPRPEPPSQLSPGSYGVW